MRPPQPGQRPAQFGPTAATYLLTALSAVRNTQNNFLSVWLNYYAARMRLARELGVMTLDHDGSWIDRPIPNSGLDGSSGSDNSPLVELKLPPAVPAEWIELTDRLQQEPDELLPAAVETPDGSVENRPIESDVRQDELLMETDHVD